MKTEWIFYLSFFLIISGATNKGTKELLKDMIRYIKTDIRAHPVTILLDYDKQSPIYKAEGIVKEISRNVPTKMISFQEVADDRQSLIPRLNYSPGMLFVLIDLSKRGSNYSNLAGPVKFMTELAKARTRPKLLIILFQDERVPHYKKLLHYVWSNKFLDATVLEVVEPMKEDHLTEINYPEMITLHHYNPYTRKTTQRNHSTKITWFPNKLRNLHRYPLDVGIVNYPPDSIVRSNTPGHVLQVTGFDEKKVKAISKEMNFETRYPSKLEKNTYSCKKGIPLRLTSNKIQFTMVEYLMITNCNQKSYTFSKGTKIMHISLVVPLLRNKPSMLIDYWKIMNSIIVLSLPLLFWTISHLIGFKDQVWDLTHMVQIVLSMEVPRDPRSLAERILFTSFLWMTFFHSSYIYMAFTDIGLYKEETLRLETIDEVLNTSFPVVMNQGHFFLLHDDSDEKIRLLLESATKLDITEEECMIQLMKHRNISCIVQSDLAQWTIDNHRDQCGQPTMRILDEHLRTTNTETLQAPGSPYVKRFDEIIQRLTDAGIINLLRRISSDESNSKTVGFEPCTSQQSELNQLLKQILIGIAFGYALSVIVFIGEIIVAKIMKVKATR